MEYSASRKISSGSLEAAKQAKGTVGKLKAVADAKDRYSEFGVEHFEASAPYSAEKLDEIADSIVEIDMRFKWGFNWDSVLLKRGMPLG